ncbi:MAG: dUTPase [Clostridiales bacterium]|nr:dUTPase [Clostridiales bacterium]
METKETTTQNEDKLDVLFRMQKGLDAYIREKRNLDYTKGEWVCKKALALMVELGEVVEEAKYKWWKNPTEIDDAKLKEEIVDVLHFFLGMCIDSGMTSDELFDIYLKKNKENYDRQNGLSSKTGYELKDN